MPDFLAAGCGLLAKWLRHKIAWISSATRANAEEVVSDAISPKEGGGLIGIWYQPLVLHAADDYYLKNGENIDLQNKKNLTE